MKYNICIVGLGYVGLPLAIEFSKKFKVVGYDINKKRVDELNKFIDITLEVDNKILKKQIYNGLILTDSIDNVKQSNVFIITVPTPIDKYNKPDLTPIIKASESIGHIIKNNDIIIYESTVYPGLTEEICVPILEKYSNLIYNKDFFVGYSPERINPGDKINTLTTIVKVTSGSNPIIAKKVDDIYKTIITAGTHLVSSIKVAEASKIIENTQRDLNIAFMNELSKIFNLLNIDTQEVLEASSTKWNFLKFTPGLVGGHCIGVDPYYLIDKSIENHYNPELLISSRKINNSMGKFIAEQTIKKAILKKININNSKALILGFSFKENCPDFRNTKVIDIYNELIEYNIKPDIFDSFVNIDEVKKEFNINILNDDNIKENLFNYSIIIIAVSHNEFKKWDIKKNKNQVIFDIKSIFPVNFSDIRL